MVEDIPSVGKVAQQRLIPQEVVGSFQPLTGSRVFDSFNSGKSDRWTGVWTFKPLYADEDLGTLSAFFKKIGRTGTFYAYDATRRVPKNGVVNGIQVQGASQTGTTLTVDGAPISSTPLVAGDYVQVETQYYQLTQDLTTNASGEGTLRIWPAIRTSPADNASVVTDNPKMVARITSIPQEETSARRRLLTEITISWEEDI